jgi:hypothetical protein
MACPTFAPVGIIKELGFFACDDRLKIVGGVPLKRVAGSWTTLEMGELNQKVASGISSKSVHKFKKWLSLLS